MFYRYNQINSTIGVLSFFPLYIMKHKEHFSLCRSTYAKTIRDSKHAREREFLKAV
jgi:hypothetical protein